MDADETWTVDDQTGLPNGRGWEAVLEAEEQRARRHGGLHGLVMVRLASGDLATVEGAADAVARSLREVDLLARVDRRTFAVLAINCDDLGRVIRRLRAALEGAGVPTAEVAGARAGADLRSVWVALRTGSGTESHPTPRLVDFVPGPPTCLN